jgi:hypothetical protein
VQPGHAHPVAFLQVRHASAQCRYDSCGFVPWDEWWRWPDGPITLGGVQVRMADAARFDLHQNLTVTRLGHRHFLYPKWFTEGMNDGGLHFLGHDLAPLRRAFRPSTTVRNRASQAG